MLLFRRKIIVQIETNKIIITHVEFIRRFLMHVLPCGFQKIRYYEFRCTQLL